MTEQGTLDGRALDDAVETVVARTDDDPQAVRDALARVSEEGTVTHDAAQAALGEAALTVATAENRAEFAALALDDAREACADHTDLALVAAQFAAFADRVAAVEERAAGLTDALAPLRDAAADPDALYALATGIRDVTASANDITRTADEVNDEVEQFSRWVRAPNRRAGPFEQEVERVADGLSDLDAAATAITAGESDDPGAARLDACYSHRVLGLLLADLRAELTALATLAERTGDDVPVARFAQRLDGLTGRHEALGERLAAIDATVEGFDDRLAAFEAALADEAPPVDWGVVGSVLAEYRSALR